GEMLCHCSTFNCHLSFKRGTPPVPWAKAQYLPTMSRNFRAYLIPSEHRRLNEFVGLLLATVAVLIGLSLISFNPDDPSLNISRNPAFAGKPANFIGTLGAF